MRRLLALMLVTSAVGALAAPSALGAFGFQELDVTFTDAEGSPAMQAGSHPFAMTTTLNVNTTVNSDGIEVPDQQIKDIEIELPPGLVGSPDAVPHCQTADFLNVVEEHTSCPDSSALGVATLRFGFTGPAFHDAAIFNLEPPPGVAAMIGFVALAVPITVEVKVNDAPPHNLIASIENASQAAYFYGSDVTLWGNPADKAHDPFRGSCVDVLDTDPEVIGSTGDCPVGIPPKPLLTLPRSCPGALQTVFEADSWQNPGTWVRGKALTHDDSIPPAPLGTIGCDKLGFSPGIEAKPSARAAESPSGLDFNVNFADVGLTSVDGNAQSDIKRAEVTLPKGMTVNPSVAEGLAVCTPQDYAEEAVGSAPGEGCPQASKIGGVEVETPLLEGKLIKGSVFVAQQDDPGTAAPGAENPFDSLLAIYMVIKDPDLGLLVKLAGKVAPQEGTGQLITTFDDVPQVPFSHFRFRFREGIRGPLVTPPTCGSYAAQATFSPWAAPARQLTTSGSFEITSGPNGAPCPSGAPPFHPGFSAGTISNAAGSYSPFYMNLTRQDGDQDLTRFSATLPPGVTAKLAGVERCSPGAIAQAKTRSGKAELAASSCPQGSQIGRVIAGAGVGPALTYASGKIYLAGPYKGAPLSVVAIVPAVAGPFDVGTVVVQQALRVNPRTGQASVDGSSSDPLPHILAGIPLKVRDINVFVDRPNFTLNPTSCDPFATQALLGGGGSDPFSLSDDTSVPAADRFQAASCAGLPFSPSLSLRLSGGTRRGAHPQLRAVLRARSADASLSSVRARLPHSAFLEQGHIRTICTRVQFAAKSCPAASIYGHVRAFTPILSEPLEGPVYLRSSNHKLPDLVADLHGLVDIEAVGRIDSVKGGIRTSFEGIPDAPLEKVILTMQGAKKGLIVNSTDLCAKGHRADVSFKAHNAKRRTVHPLVVAASCQKAKKKAGKGGRTRVSSRAGGR